MAACTVTIDKLYFEDLLRRAHLEPGSTDWETPIDLPVVNIPKVDHDTLLRLAGEYTTLRKVLLDGGIAPETLEILIAGPHDDYSTNESAPVPKAPQQAMNSSFVTQNHAHRVPRIAPVMAVTQKQFNVTKPEHTASMLQARAGNVNPPRLSGPAMRLEGSGEFLLDGGQAKDHSASFEPSEFEYDDEDMGEFVTKQSHFYSNNRDRRSLVLSNLAPSTTHKDVAAAIRGGQILDMYFRPGRDLAANVAFVEGASAQAFFEHVKRYDLYINGRRIEVSWNERQFVLQGHIASRIANNGATRNLCLASISPQITAERIRDDLDHIHNLVVVDLWFDGNCAFVSLNSVAAACFARQCLMSRLDYKNGTKIKYFADDCALPLPEKPKPRFNSAVVGKGPIKKGSSASLNRFQALNLGSESSESGDSDFTVTTGFEGGVLLS